MTLVNTPFRGGKRVLNQCDFSREFTYPSDITWEISKEERAVTTATYSSTFNLDGVIDRKILDDGDSVPHHQNLYEQF
jgi:hypothetical protein